MTTSLIVRLNSGEPVALFKNQTIRLAVLTLAVFKVVSTVAIAKTANKTTSSGEPSYKKMYLAIPSQALRV